jgi:hypothetical protein
MLHLRRAVLLLHGAAMLAGPRMLRAQEAPATPIDTSIARRYFQEAAALTARDGGRLWGRSLAGPLLLVDRASRVAIADQPDSAGLLRPLGSLYAGTLPARENVVNTALRWGGVTWAMLAWPIIPDSTRRGVLFAHELWHRVQDSLGFGAGNPVNPHLAERDGRLWLRLEGRALRRAISLDGAAQARALRDAIAFRRARRQLFPGSDSTERALELNEGLAEYTGVAIGAGSDAVRLALVDAGLAVLDTTGRLERSFAYETGPAYGLFLDAASPAWRTSLTTRSDLAFLLESSLRGAEPVRPAAAVTRAAGYGYAAVRKEERVRATNRIVHVAALRKRFLSGPVLELPLAEMRMGFDPAQVEGLEGVGTVYGALRLTDRWGVLQCDASGGLISADFGRAFIPAPADTTGRRLTGPGWVLELLPEWHIVPGARKGDWKVTAFPGGPAPPP